MSEPLLDTITYHYRQLAHHNAQFLRTLADFIEQRPPERPDIDIGANYSSSYAACRRRTPRILGIGDYGTSATRTTIYSGSPDRKPKPRISSNAW